MSKRIPQEIKDQILQRIAKDGITAAQASREHGISYKTVYGWLSADASIPVNILQLNKLKRENDELKKLLGEAMLLQERSKKNHARHAFA
jgi:transposase-like protein